MLTGLVPFNVPRRSTQLPPLYLFPGPHLYHPVKFPFSRTFVYLLDSSPEGKKLSFDLSEAQPVPPGPVEGIYCAFQPAAILSKCFLTELFGLVELQPGDAFLGRPINGGGRPEHDCLQVLVAAQ